MINHSATIIRRDSNGPPGPPPTMISLLVVLLVLLILALLLVAGLLYMRHRRRAQRNHSSLPMYDEKHMSTASTASSHRRIMARPSESVHVYQEKQNLMEHSTGPPSNPLPQIHITFPEEYDDAGRRVSGRVVVVRVGDNGVGLEPVEDLPAYQQEEDKRFQSLDLERIGGLVDKARNAPSYDKFEKL